MENFFKRMFGEKKKAFVFTSRNLAEPTSNGERIRRAPGDNGGNRNSDYIIIGDYVDSRMNTITSSTSFGSSGVAVPADMVKPPSKPSDERKEVQPKEVFNEIKKEGLEIDFTNLDEKIKVVEERIEVLEEHLDKSHLIDEHKALFFLKNRRAYLKTQKKNPINWAMTNREAIDDLCKRYKLRTVPLKQYYTLLPKEAIKEMERYTKAYKAITKDAPIFELIIKEQEVKKEEQEKRAKKDRDPILVANSPLGDFMFVIGAWDDEVEVVDEIIYYGK